MWIECENVDILGITLIVIIGVLLITICALLYVVGMISREMRDTGDRNKW